MERVRCNLWDTLLLRATEDMRVEIEISIPNNESDSSIENLFYFVDDIMKFDNIAVSREV